MRKIKKAIKCPAWVAPIGACGICQKDPYVRVCGNLGCVYCDVDSPILKLTDDDPLWDDVLKEQMEMAKDGSSRNQKEV